MLLFRYPDFQKSTALYLASIIELSLGRPITRVQIAALAWGVNILSGIVNTFGTKAVGGLSTFNLWWTLGGTVVLVVTLLVKAPEKVSMPSSAPDIITSTDRTGIEHRDVCVHGLRKVQSFYFPFPTPRHPQRTDLSSLSASRVGHRKPLSSFSASCKQYTPLKDAKPLLKSLKKQPVPNSLPL